MNSLKNIEALQIRFQKDLGEINSKRRELLIELLSNRFETYDSESESILFFYDKSPDDDDDDESDQEFSQGLIITPNGVNFLLSHRNEGKNSIEFITKILSEIFNTLLLEPKDLGLIVEIINQHKLSDNESSLDTSLSLINTNFSFSDIQGVGLRFFLDNEKFTGELRVEPLIEDTTFFYINQQLKFKDLINIDQIDSLLTDQINDLLSRTSLILQK